MPKCADSPGPEGVARSPDPTGDSARHGKSPDAVGIEAGAESPPGKLTTDTGAMEAAEELALLTRVQRGELGAFDAIVRRYLRRGFAVAYRLVGDHHDAEDVVQEAFLAALTHIDSYDLSRRFAPWFYRIVATRSINHRRSRTLRRTEVLEPDTRASNPDRPDRDAERNGLREDVGRALGALPEQQRLIITLFELDGFSGEEIGAMLDMPAGTVRWHVHLARRALRGLLASYQEPDE
ncbi:MAG: sigma-70 family RNA polymerase sigma factor [Gemmatimonadota bacterium]